MLELSILDASALTVLRLIAWANVGMAVALLVAVGVWLLCCELESRSYSGRRASGQPRPSPGR